MLRQRVITALILMAGLIAITTLSSSVVFALAMIALVAIAGFEWSAFLRMPSANSRLFYVASLVLSMFALLYLFNLNGQLFEGVNDSVKTLDSRVTVVLLFGALFWCLVCRWIVGYPENKVEWNNESKIAVMGLLVLLPAWAGIVQLKYLMPSGILVIALVILVASVDVGAYFSGTYFGKTPLAKKLSPKKTWEGVAGGSTLCLLLTAAFTYLFHLRIAALDSLSVALLVLLSVVISFYAVMGDLLESMLKRNSDLKDSGSILPGHGGVLDRIDAMVAVVPFFTLAVNVILGDYL